MNRTLSFLLIGLFLILSCAKEDESGGLVSTPSDSYSIALDFTRVPLVGLDDIDVVVSVKNNDVLAPGLTPTITLETGSKSTTLDNGDGTYSFRITPTQTGEHKVTASYGGITFSRTPLVLYDVDAAWGQPMSIPGYVNTEGYEDGATVTADGQYFFVQTGPQYHAGNEVMTNLCGGPVSRVGCSHVYLDTIPGPYTAPERPGFWDGRYSGTTILHNANSWGLVADQAPNYAVSTMFYGFKRQSDGSYKEPFYVDFSDVNDGIITPFGLSFYLNGDGTALTTFTLEDPSIPGQNFDVYNSTITLGQNNNLGDFVADPTPGQPPLRGATFNSNLIDFDNSGATTIPGTQGNNHMHVVGGDVVSIWTDDEYDVGGDHGDLTVNLNNNSTISDGTLRGLSSSSWTSFQLPSKINSVNDEVMPFFTGTGLYFARDTGKLEIYYASYSGTHTQADLTNNANWGTPVKLLASDPSSASLGRIVGLGEPTVATIDGEEYLYFVYVVFRAYDAAITVSDLNFQAGFIKKN